MQAIISRQFNPWRTVGSAAAQVSVYEARGVDELFVLDIGATAEGRRPDLEFLRELLRGALMPITVGGGFQHIEDKVAAIRVCGADKIAVGHGLYHEGMWDALYKPAQRLGRQALSAIINHVDQCVWWRGDLLAGYTVADAARHAEASQAGEIVLNSVDRDGMMDGYDLRTIEAVARAVSIPVVVLGGAGTYEHLYEAFQSGAHAVAAGAMFAFTEARPRAAAEYLAARGIATRTSD